MRLSSMAADRSVLSPTTRVLGAFALLGALASGCSDPVFAGNDDDGGADDAEVVPETPKSDASVREVDDDATMPEPDAVPVVPVVPDGGAPDAGEPIDPIAAKFPAWAPQLKGRYAVQAFSFAEDSYTVARMTDLWLVTIALEDGEYIARIRTCEQVAVNNIGTVKMLNIDRFPERRHRVFFDGDSFRTEPLEIGIGYDDALPKECEGKPGAEVPKRSFQTWLTGPSCVCGTDPIPSEQDCRITDPDGDKIAGFSIEVTGPIASIKYRPYGISASRTGLVQGHVTQGGKHTAYLAVREQSVQLGSTGTAFMVPSRAPPCPPETSRVSFYPLDRMTTETEWTCGALLSRKKELFTNPPLATPMHCGI